MLLCTSISCDQKVRVPIQITLFLVYLESKIIFTITLNNVKSSQRSISIWNWPFIKKNEELLLHSFSFLRFFKYKFLLI